MIYFLLLTALTVSVDSFFCGFSLSFTTSKKLPVIFFISLTVFVMCLTTNYLTFFFVDKITERTACLGGIILIFVGIYNLFKNKDNTPVSIKSTIRQSLSTGFAVGIDGATANLSLSLMGLNNFYVPLTIALFHALMIWLGISLALCLKSKKFAKIGFVPPLVLIILGAYKLLGLFI